MNARFVSDVLKRNHPAAAGWIFLTEVRTPTGYAYSKSAGLHSHRYIDAFAIHTWRSKNFRRVAYEIKVSRADWLSELKDCKKRTHAYFLSNQFYFAAAQGIVDPQKDDLDCLDGCGLLEITEEGETRLLLRARHREAWPMPDDFITSLLRKAYSLTPETIPSEELLIR